MFTAQISMGDAGLVAASRCKTMNMRWFRQAPRTSLIPSTSPLADAYGAEALPATCGRYSLLTYESGWERRNAQLASTLGTTWR